MRMGFTLALAGLGIGYFFSTPFVATQLARSLECRTPYLATQDAPRADAIVVLGGGEGFHTSDTNTVYFFERTGDRIERAIQAFNAGKAPLLACGGGQFATGDNPLVGEWLRDRAIERGIPREAIIAGGPALVTADECEGLAKQLRLQNVQHILLCTSATHMPRAKLLYEQQGFQVTALASDFDTRGKGESFSFKLFLPRGIALAQSETCIKEWLGLITYWMTSA